MGKDVKMDISPKKIQKKKKTTEHRKRCSTSLVIREMQLQTTMKHYMRPTKMVGIKINKPEHHVVRRTQRNWITHTLLVGM